MHYSLSLVGNTIIVYHALTRVLGNDKRFGVELPHAGYRSENALFREMVGEFVPPSWAKLVIVGGDAAYGSKANMDMVKDRDKADTARRSVILSLLVDHCLFLHPDQLAQLSTHLPAYTVGSLRANVQVACLVDVIQNLISSDDPQSRLQRFTQALYTVFAFGHSKKHLLQRQLGRLEPTPSLKYRADEVMRHMPALST
jgi:hypothetical protein